METLLPGITVERVPTTRLTVAVLPVAGRSGPAVLFVHGNVSSSLFWQPTMLALPQGGRRLVPGQLTRGGRVAGLRAGRSRRAEHDGAHPLPDRRPVRRSAHDGLVAEAG